jgi:hypothetical protein
VNQVILQIQARHFENLNAFQDELPENKKPESWINAGGQLIRQRALDKMIADIHYNRIKGWPDIHHFYMQESEKYPSDKLQHALDVLHEVYGISFKKIKPAELVHLLQQSVSTAEWIKQGIISSRKKDYLNPFRKMVYANQTEMDQILGKFDDNSFIKTQEDIFNEFQLTINRLIDDWSLK